VHHRTQTKKTAILFLSSFFFPLERFDLEQFLYFGHGGGGEVGDAGTLVAEARQRLTVEDAILLVDVLRRPEDEVQLRRLPVVVGLELQVVDGIAAACIRQRLLPELLVVGLFAVSLLVDDDFRHVLDFERQVSVLLRLDVLEQLHRLLRRLGHFL